MYTETFTDKGDKNKREYQRPLYIVDKEHLLNEAQFCRFQFRGEMQLPPAPGDIPCDLYFLEKI
jgi:hypothetical protein